MTGCEGRRGIRQPAARQRERQAKYSPAAWIAMR
jgi:hypothetical protein